MWVNSLRVKLVCKVCGRRDPGIRIQWTGAGEFRYGAERPVDIGPHSAIDTYRVIRSVLIIARNLGETSCHARQSQKSIRVHPAPF